MNVAHRFYRPAVLELLRRRFHSIAVADPSDFIRTKEAAGQAKDRAALPLLWTVLEESRRTGDG